MTPSGMKILSCPACGYRVSGLEGACPRCGKVFDKDSKFECPFCGTLVPASADSCPSCQIDYLDFSSKAEKKLLDKAMDKILEELDSLMEPGEGGPVCPKCSSPLDAPGVRCPHCGFTPKAKDKPSEEIPPEPEEPPASTDALCPICGAWVKSDDPSCRECGAEFVADEGEMVDDGELVYCPVCDEPVGFDVTLCPHCGAEFEEEEVQEPEIVEAPPQAEKAPSLTADEEEVVEEMDLVPPPPTDVPVRRRTPPARPKPAEKRPGKAPAVVIPRPKAVSKRIAGARKAGEVVTARRERAAVEQRGLSNGAGIINGKGQVNGRHFINGVGAVNGRDRVNGTGFINGKESVGRLSGRRRVMLMAKMRWQFLAVLVAILITVPAFIYLSHQRSQSPYAVDGDFTDWERSMTFAVMIESSDPATNVVEWSIGSHNTDLYVYARTEQNLMADGEAERLVLFIDADGSEESGYRVADIGADYMLDILGWDGAVMSSIASEFRLDQDGDHLNWNSWHVIGSVASYVVAAEIEAMVRLPAQVNESTRLILTTQNEDGIGCVSYTVPLDGGLLVVEQAPVPEVALNEVLIQDTEAGLLRLRFSSQGEGGDVSSVTPLLEGVSSFSAIPAFSLDVGDTHTVDLRVDSSQVMPEEYVSARVTAEGISSSFSRVQIIGEGASAYCLSLPSSIIIDGAFGDWLGKTVKDTDDLPVPNQNVDIDEVGAESSSTDSFFYLSVYGELCAGVYIPKSCTIPSGSGTGPVVTERRTAEDYVRIHIDADHSATTGETMSLGTMTIGADYVIDISGVNCEIESATISAYFAGTWIELSTQAEAEKDERRMEIGVPSVSIGSPTDIDFIIEMTDWRGCQDLASNESTETMKGWVVDSSTSSDATSMSYQRKLFHDGTNFWSIYYDGDDTVYSYSSDDGETWNVEGDVFSTSGIMDVSVWYDSSNQLVYAVGDKSTPSQNVYLQRGSVSPGTHAITWAVSDSNESVSSVSVGGKNAFICKDLNGYLWILTSQQTQSGPDKFDLAAYISDSTDSISSGWTLDTTFLSPDSTNGDLKGSILPAGSGSDVWVVYNHDSSVDAMKRTSGSWGSVENVYTDTGSMEFMNTAPASTVIDGNGVVHVVYGDATKDGQEENPHIQYRYRTASGWQTAITLDIVDDTVGHRYPTISLDTSTGNVYAFWLQNTDDDILCKKNVSGSWSFVDLNVDTSYVKQFLTSIYSASGEAYICWQWTQNTSSNIEVIFDVIPEFEDVLVPVFVIIAIFLVGMRRRRLKSVR
ncbi:MAG: hypothetical protein JSV90_04305 [Methanobacteriota archaeon]|nr:MAG: hypothetical protein JSV90_04305 [Euryarchaeota archaeon]